PARRPACSSALAVRALLARAPDGDLAARERGRAHHRAVRARSRRRQNRARALRTPASKLSRPRALAPGLGDRAMMRKLLWLAVASAFACESHLVVGVHPRGMGGGAGEAGSGDGVEAGAPAGGAAGEAGHGGSAGRADE